MRSRILLAVAGAAAWVAAPAGAAVAGGGADLRARHRQPLLLNDLVRRGDLRQGRLVHKPEDQAIIDMEPRAVSQEQEASDFQEFDENGDGFISLREMRDNFRDMNLSEEDLKKIYSKLDLDNNGQVTWAEFNTPLDTQLFDFLDRTHNLADAKEIEFTEDLYTNEFGNPFASMRNEPASEYNIRGEEITKPSSDEKYLPGYGWFTGESPVIDVMYPNIQTNRNPDDGDGGPGKTYKYSYGFLQRRSALAPRHK